MGRDESQVLMVYHPKANSTRYCCSLCDVRRFDVEGACNIRYKIMKKRLEKAHISTGERPTQPGKIALVYSNEK